MYFIAEINQNFVLRPLFRPEVLIYLGNKVVNLVLYSYNHDAHSTGKAGKMAKSNFRPRKHREFKHLKREIQYQENNSRKKLLRDVDEVMFEV